VAPFNIATYRKQFAIAYRDVQRLYIAIRWNNIVAMLESRPVNHNDSLVNNWLLTCYAETVAVGIRRQAEGNEGAPKATVGSLLLRIENQSGRVHSEGSWVRLRTRPRPGSYVAQLCWDSQI